MAVNTIPITNRTIPSDNRVTAGGGYTLPQFAFIPHPILSQIGSGFVQAPGAAGTSAAFTAPPQITGRPYPGSQLRGAFGIRQANVKASPGA